MLSVKSKIHYLYTEGIKYNELKELDGLYIKLSKGKKINYHHASGSLYYVLAHRLYDLL